MELQTPSFSDSNGLDDTLLVFPLYLLDSIKKELYLILKLATPKTLVIG